VSAQPIGLDLVHHHPHLVRLLARLLMGLALPKPTSILSVPAEISERVVRISNLIATHARARHFGHFGGAVFKVLKNLFHVLFCSFPGLAAGRAALYPTGKLTF
jgi:hypothetical protein